MYIIQYIHLILITIELSLYKCIYDAYKLYMNESYMYKDIYKYVWIIYSLQLYDFIFYFVIISQIV